MHRFTLAIYRINNSNLGVQKFCLFRCASCVYFFFNFFESDQKSEKEFNRNNSAEKITGPTTLRDGSATTDGTRNGGPALL
jgi:hypothetical protein